MQDIGELERRLAAALDRIGRGLEAAPKAAAAAPAGSEDEELTRLRAELTAERAANQQMRDRVRNARDRENLSRGALEERVEKLTRQLDVQGIELQRMRKSSVTLREDLRRIREAAQGTVEPGQINRALVAELEALRTMRLSEAAELDEIAAELDRHLTEAEHA
jgi:hypothetical protein